MYVGIGPRGPLIVVVSVIMRMLPEGRRWA
jgi:hypothetical protein